MLKNAWLQSLLRRPATMQREPGRYVRPAVFICLQQNACKLLFINRLLVCCTPLSLHCTPHSERDFPAPRTPAVDRSGFDLCRPPPPTPTSRWPERSRRCASTPARIPELSWQPLKRDDAGTNKRFVRCAAFACIPWPSRAGTSDISTDTLGPTLTMSSDHCPAAWQSFRAGRRWSLGKDLPAQAFKGAPRIGGRDPVALRGLREFLRRGHAGPLVNPRTVGLRVCGHGLCRCRR